MSFDAIIRGLFRYLFHNNARSGRCPEDCKWCAQSVHYKTAIDIYPLVDGTKAMQLAKYNASFNIRRFSFVTSGRSVTGGEIDRLAAYTSEILEATDMKVCASLGLVGREDMQKLYDSGVTRYHCNLESSPSFFRKLCTTHTVEQKIETLERAKSVGMSVCSGGIIGMGETMRDRIEMALALRRIGVDSDPRQRAQSHCRYAARRQRLYASGGGYDIFRHNKGAQPRVGGAYGRRSKA